MKTIHSLEDAMKVDYGQVVMDVLDAYFNNETIEEIVEGYPYKLWIKKYEAVKDKDEKERLMCATDLAAKTAKAEIRLLKEVFPEAKVEPSNYMLQNLKTMWKDTAYVLVLHLFGQCLDEERTGNGTEVGIRHLLEKMGVLQQYEAFKQDEGDRSKAIGEAMPLIIEYADKYTE